MPTVGIWNQYLLDDKCRRGLVVPLPISPSLAVSCLILFTNEEELTVKSDCLLLLQFCICS